jgi:hypothetical protein
MKGATVLFLLSILPANAIPPCAQSPKLTGRCFSVRGKLSLANGNPSWRIHSFGTRRVLGIFDGNLSDSEGGGLPPSVLHATELSHDFNRSVAGTFDVCPLTPERPGHMRFVCIAGLK